MKDGLLTDSLYGSGGEAERDSKDNEKHAASLPYQFGAKNVSNGGEDREEAACRERVDSCWPLGEVKLEKSLGNLCHPSLQRPAYQNQVVREANIASNTR